MTRKSKFYLVLAIAFAAPACSGSSPSDAGLGSAGVTSSPSGSLAGSSAGTAAANPSTGGSGVQTMNMGGAAGSHAGVGSGTAGTQIATGGIGTSGSGSSAGSGGSSSGGNSTGGAGDAGASGGSGSAATGGQSGSSDCSAPPSADSVLGWATVMGMTDGGGSAQPMTVTTFDALKSAVSGTSAATVWIKGSLTGNLDVGSNKSLIGICGAELHGHVEVSGSSNVIIRNLKIVGYGVGDCSLDPKYDSSVGCSSGQDAISVQKNATHIWIDHCDISDGTDGNLDITNAANYVTVSWTKFHYTPRTDPTGSDSTGAEGHRFCNLVGGTDSPSSSYDDAHTLNVSWHHNWWADNVVERQPRVRFGKNHLWNNLWSSTESSYCVRAGKQAQILVEKSVFTGVMNPLEFNSSTDQTTANITSTNNVFTSTSGMQATGGGGPALTSVPYTYMPDDTASLEQTIRAQAGPH